MLEIQKSQPKLLKQRNNERKYTKEMVKTYPSRFITQEM
jgi:hypothetical protein